MLIRIKRIQEPSAGRFLPVENPMSALRRLPATRLILFLALLPALAPALAAQQPLSLADADLRGQAMFQQSASTGMVLVVVRGHEVMIKSYGETFPASGHAPSANSFIRLCSPRRSLPLT